MPVSAATDARSRVRTDGDSCVSMQRLGILKYLPRTRFSVLAGSGMREVLKNLVAPPKSNGRREIYSIYFHKATRLLPVNFVRICS